MKLYFSPLACSLSARVAIYEAQAAGADVPPVEFVEVDTRTQRAADGGDYRSTHALGLVPALRLGNGEVLTENAAILQYIAETCPNPNLVPPDVLDRARLRQWLSFIGSELHKAIYAPLLDPSATEPVRRRALAAAERRLPWLSEQLAARDYLLAENGVADAYLSTVLNWSSVTPIELQRWPNLHAYLKRVQARPAVARALAEELELYRRQVSRHAARDRDAGGPRGATASLTTEELMARFNAAFQRHDPSALEPLIADDCVLENTHPAPDGSRHEGREACLSLWSSIASAPGTEFQLERVDVFADRATIFWKLHCGGNPPVRGVNLMRVREGKISEALGYVKG